MGKRSCLVIMSVVSLLVLTQSAPADLMKINFSIGLSIPINEWTVESGTMGYWLKDKAWLGPDTSDIFNYSTFSRMFAFDKESLILFSDILMATIVSDADLFAASLNGTTFEAPITGFLGNSLGGTAWVPFYDLSSLIGKTPTLFPNMWH